MILNHIQKMEIIERIWSLDTKIKQLRSQIEIRGIKMEDTILRDIEQKIKEVQFCLHESLPEKPIGYIWEHISYDGSTKERYGI